MKICPTCRRTYDDDGLNFCLEDGTVLSVASSEPPPTVMMHQPPPTTPAAALGQTQDEVRTSWDQKPQYTMQPQKSSKTWLFVVGLLGIGLLICGGGVVGFIALMAMQSDDPPTEVVTSKSPVSDVKEAEKEYANVQKIDLSRWVDPKGKWGKTEYIGDEFSMTSTRPDYFFVLVTTKDYSTEGASARVTVRNRRNMDSRLGYGLVFHSDPSPLQQGYAFLIDSKRKRYRVVRHDKTKEVTVIEWTNSNAIKDGTQLNVLEVKHNDDLFDILINGEKVTTVRNTHGFKGGVAGLYSGGAAVVGFRNFEIRK
ncbi:MAG TPA: hypothetical protein PKD24_04760 [Pyrinomonadaceae bacterium]|nr:hypothetical protein [Pyrinomonadaceae bacterium]HMP64863.1 hypothetical protein [Pyrinomonadaceae bacterium]